MVEAARSAGVGRVVMLSVYDGGAGDGPIGLWCREGEAAVVDSGMDWTLLRPGRFMSNALHWAAMVRRGDSVTIPFATRPAVPVDPADIAAVAVAAFASQGPRNVAYQLSGPEVLTPTDELRILGEALGRPLQLIEPSTEVARAGMLAAGVAEVISDAIVARSLADEPPAEILATVQELLGRPSATFDSWAKRPAELFQNGPDQKTN